MRNRIFSTIRQSYDVMLFVFSVRLLAKNHSRVRRKIRGSKVRLDAFSPRRIKRVVRVSNLTGRCANMTCSAGHSVLPICVRFKAGLTIKRNGICIKA